MKQFFIILIVKKLTYKLKLLNKNTTVCPISRDNVL